MKEWYGWREWEIRLARLRELVRREYPDVYHQEYASAQKSSDCVRSYISKCLAYGTSYQYRNS